MVRFVARELLGRQLDNLQFKNLKNPDFRETVLEDKDGTTVLKVGIANGFRNIQNLVQKLKRKRCDYDYVEVMACPSGCLNGGAQLRPVETVETAKEMICRLEESHRSLMEGILPEENNELSLLLEAWPEVGLEGGERNRILMTQYREVEKMTNGLAVKW